MSDRLNAAGGSGESSTLGCIPTGVQFTMMSAIELARIAHDADRQPTASAKALARSSWRLVIVTLAPWRDSPKAIERAAPPAPRINACLSVNGDGPPGSRP